WGVRLVGGQSPDHRLRGQFRHLERRQHQLEPQLPQPRSPVGPRECRSRSALESTGLHSVALGGGVTMSGNEFIEQLVSLIDHTALPAEVDVVRVRRLTKEENEQRLLRLINSVA